MKLTRASYHTIEANKAYWSVSQFKAFKECEARGLAESQGKYIRPETEALLMGGYVDAHFSDMSDVYCMNHPQIFNSRTGELKAQYQKADKAIKRAERDNLFMKYLDGKKQEVMTGELFGQPWKVMVDFLHDDKIVDLKFMRDMASVFKDGERKPFIDAWGYDIQGFVYQQIVEQNTGKKLPFYLAVITKEDVPDIDIIHVPQWKLNGVASLVEHYIGKFAPVKIGQIEPERCEKCNYCKETKVLTDVTEYEEFIEK